MSIAEMDTVVRLGLPMVVVVYNDEAYGAEVHHFGPEGHDLDIVEFPPTDIASIARGFGFESMTVRDVGDLEPLQAWVDGDRGRPVLVGHGVVLAGEAERLAGERLAAHLDVLDEANAALYWRRSDRFDTVLDIGFTRPGLDALCRVLEAWIGHFFRVEVRIQPVEKISDDKWIWHVGLDAEGNRLLNDLYNGAEVEEARMTAEDDGRRSGEVKEPVDAAGKAPIVADEDAIPERELADVVDLTTDMGAGLVRSRSTYGASSGA